MNFFKKTFQFYTLFDRIIVELQPVFINRVIEKRVLIMISVSKCNAFRLIKHKVKNNLTELSRIFSKRHNIHKSRKCDTHCDSLSILFTSECNFFTDVEIKKPIFSRVYFI